MTRLDVGLGVVMVVAILAALLLAMTNHPIPELVEVIAYAAAGGLGVRQHHRVLGRRGNR